MVQYSNYLFMAGNFRFYQPYDGGIRVVDDIVMWNGTDLGDMPDVGGPTVFGLAVYEGDLYADMILGWHGGTSSTRASGRKCRRRWSVVHSFLRSLPSRILCMQLVDSLLRAAYLCNTS